MADKIDSRERFLAAAKKLTSGKRKVIQEYQGKKTEESQPQPTKSKFEQRIEEKRNSVAELKAKFEAAKKKNADPFDDLVEKYKVVSSLPPGASVSLGPNVFPSAVLGLDKDPSVMGVDLGQMSDEEKKQFFLGAMNRGITEKQIMDVYQRGQSMREDNDG